MKQILVKKGTAFTKQVPIPKIGKKELLVCVQSTSVSVGTELSSVRGSGIPMWKRAIAHPEKIFTTLKHASDNGIKQTLNLIKEKKDAEFPTGYSAAGIVVATGSDIRDFTKGDKVACAGGEYAYHAEYIRVTENLCVKIPSDVSFEEASSITLGAIALQGIRRAEPTLGETFCVLGLGILGQITTQILKANGCKVIGSDLDKFKIKKALSLGMDFGFNPDEVENESIARITDGYGVDGVIITAATSSDDIISKAFQICRKKGRVILVGDVGLNLNREDFYSKEIDFLISTSYGPGRYDSQYEENGLDYPIGYVRWTENRNMKEYLNLISKKSIKIIPLITDRYPIEQSSSAFKKIESENKPLLLVITYPKFKNNNIFSNKKLIINSNFKVDKSKLIFGIIGGGSFARSSHLPNIKMLKSKCELKSIVCKTGNSARSLGNQFGAEYVSTDHSDVINDKDINAVVISTRHDLHGTLLLEALSKGKHVLVEKPTTINQIELNKLKKFYETNDIKKKSPKPILLTGYNRRFSPHFKIMRKLVKQSQSPFILNYKMNAGYIPKEHWVHGPEGGGRNIGEACHIYDFFIALAEEEIIGYSVQSINPRNKHYSRNDNFVATLRFREGSVANLIYTSLGHSDYPKETAELYVDGKVAFLDDYKSLIVHGSKKDSLRLKKQNKGIFEELNCFIDCIKRNEWPIPLWQQIHVNEISFAIEKMIYDF